MSFSPQKTSVSPSPEPVLFPNTEEIVKVWHIHTVFFASRTRSIHTKNGCARQIAEWPKNRGWGRWKCLGMVRAWVQKCLGDGGIELGTSGVADARSTGWATRAMAAVGAKCSDKGAPPERSKGEFEEWNLPKKGKKFQNLNFAKKTITLTPKKLGKWVKWAVALWHTANKEILFLLAEKVHGKWQMRWENLWLTGWVSHKFFFLNF